MIEKQPPFGMATDPPGEIVGSRWGFAFWFFLVCTIFVAGFTGLFIYSRARAPMIGSLFVVAFFGHLTWRTQRMRHLKIEATGLTVHRFFGTIEIPWTEIDEVEVSTFDGRGEGVSSCQPRLRLTTGKRLGLIGFAAHPSRVGKVQDVVDALQKAKGRYARNGTATL
jgi:hypothetical protein